MEKEGKREEVERTRYTICTQRKHVCVCVCVFVCRRTDCRYEGRVEGVLGEAEEDAGFADARVSDEQQLEQIVIGLGHLCVGLLHSFTRSPPSALGLRAQAA